MKMCGLELLTSDLLRARERGVSITIYSSQKETHRDCFDLLVGMDGIRHFTVGTIYFHPKLYYGRTLESFTAILGSANLTKGGLLSNEELSFLIDGSTADESHLKILQYLERLSSLQRFHSPPSMDKKPKDYKFQPVHKVLKGGTQDVSTAPSENAK
jgi:HKD family nuclease